MTDAPLPDKGSQVPDVGSDELVKWARTVSPEVSRVHAMADLIEVQERSIEEERSNAFYWKDRCEKAIAREGATLRRIRELKEAEVRHIDEKREWMERADKAERRVAELERSNDRHAKDHLKCINELNLAKRNGNFAIERAEKAEAAYDALDKCYEELQKAMSRMAARNAALETEWTRQNTFSQEGP